MFCDCVPHFRLDFRAASRLNSGAMKELSLMLVGALALLAFPSCSGGDCGCNGYNKDYLRDVPVTRAQRFDNSPMLGN